jgi:hypothetical protein
MRDLGTKAVRDVDLGKVDYEGCFSPLVLHEFASFMQEHNRTVDGTVRTCSDWKSGWSKEAYMKSMWRHFFDLWALYSGMFVYKERTPHGEFTHIFRGRPGFDVTEGWTEETIKTAGLALMFNLQGFMHEHLKQGA